MFITRLIACFVLLLCVSSAPHGEFPKIESGKNCSCLLGQLLLALSDLVKNQPAPCNQQLSPAAADPDATASALEGTTEKNENKNDPNSSGLGAQGSYLSTTSEPTTKNSAVNPDGESSTKNPDSDTTKNDESNTDSGATVSTTSNDNGQGSTTTENSGTQTTQSTNTNDETATASSKSEDKPNFAIAEDDTTVSTTTNSDAQDNTTTERKSDNAQTTTDPTVLLPNNHNHDSKKCSCGNIDGQFYVPLLRFEGKPDKEAFKFYLDCLFNRKS